MTISKILIVDDSPTEALFMSDLLGKKGFKVSVAGNSVIFVAAPLQDRACAPSQAQADDDLVGALTEAATWRRQGDVVSFIGARSLRFRINTN